MSLVPAMSLFFFYISCNSARNTLTKLSPESFDSLNVDYQTLTGLPNPTTIHSVMVDSMSSGDRDMDMVAFHTGGLRIRIHIRDQIIPDTLTL